jgi:predicted kinase
MAQATLYILRGLPASGKSTWARQMVDKGEGRVKRINRDELRLMIDNGQYSAQNEYLIVRLRDMMAMQALLLGYTVIIDDTNIEPHTIWSLKRLAETCLAKIEAVHFTASTATCVQRDALREKPVGEAVILSMSAQMEMYLKTAADPLADVTAVYYFNDQTEYGFNKYDPNRKKKEGNDG